MCHGSVLAKLFFGKFEIEWSEANSGTRAKECYIGESAFAKLSNPDDLVLHECTATLSAGKLPIPGKP